ncbi:TAF6-like RNA polymerase II p300/CBP-associated factor-associated factor 65 kDa subunit 6L [Biomphalaria pfeifferi]|uniref:Histone H4 n=1 Tax=Biomphalaria pfeifferi TaxID=112525 RepID=A0AAD8EXF5_BIOPF|nr:TAF6-like RNA polymerase II p300/CBP-associated factor-associated factor 65 kDa subunit 6L [Biomphalaria pfeifferi]
MTSEERRHQMEEKTYAVFTAASINTMAESAQLSPIPHEAAVVLGEDASYQVRQVVMLATQYMKHAKRRRLAIDDFNRAAKEMNVMPVHGYGAQDPLTFRHIKDTEIHCVEDSEVNLVDVALGSYVPKQIGLPSIKAHWLAVEGIIKISQGGSSNSVKSSRELSPPHLKYYNCMTKALLSANAVAIKKALGDLKTNPNIVPVLPYLINFVLSGIKSMTHDIGHLTTLLNTVRALLHNKALYLMHKPYLSTIIQAVEFCVLEPLAASIYSVNDHWVLRDYAARLLAEIVNRWNSPQNHLRFNTIKCLREVLQDLHKPFYSHYGAVMALIALGHKAVEDVVLPHLPVFWPHLCSAIEDKKQESVNKADAFKVQGALRLAAEKVICRHLRRFQDLTKVVKEREEVAEMLDLDQNADVQEPIATAVVSGETKNVKDLYTELYEYFGDSLSNCLPLVETHHVFKAQKKDQVVNLGDSNSGKGGEELLENLMEQIKLQEKLEAERREREILEQKEREQREREQRARQMLEQMKKVEEERKKRLKREEEEQKRRRLEMEETERLKKLKEEEERRGKEWEEQIKELNKNRSKPQWQQEVELRRAQLEEEIQYSKMLEAKKRQEMKERAKQEEEEEKQRRQREVEEELKRKEAEDEQAGRSRVGLRRRKPVNYTEKDEDISDLFDDPKSKTAAKIPKLNPLSDISDDSDGDFHKRLLAGQTAASTDGLAVSKMIDPAKGLLKLKIKRQSNYASTPPHPMSVTPQHNPSAYHSPSMMSPIYSPHSASHSTPPLLPGGTSHKSSSGSEKEGRHKRGSTSSSKHSRAGSAGIQDISDPEDLLLEPQLSSIPTSLLHSPGAESSGSDSNPHRKALKLTLKLTPKDSASE